MNTYEYVYVLVSRGLKAPPLLFSVRYTYRYQVTITRSNVTYYRPVTVSVFKVPGTNGSADAWRAPRAPMFSQKVHAGRAVSATAVAITGPLRQPPGSCPTAPEIIGGNSCGTNGVAYVLFWSARVFRVEDFYAFVAFAASHWSVTCSRWAFWI